MTYSFTEKKRIRKSFAKRAAVLDVPFLLATQINSYAEFLQSEVPGDNRRGCGHAELFFHVLDELRELEDGQLRYCFQNLCTFHCHLLNSKRFLNMSCV